jgi:hypothetical protein
VGHRLVDVREMSLTANGPPATPVKWNVQPPLPEGGGARVVDVDGTVTLRPREIRTFLVKVVKA